MNSKIIFIAGVHGVGKGFISRQLSNEFDLPTLSASELIRKEKLSDVSVGKNVIDADNNQDHLVRAINKLILDKCLILDGHFCLKTNSGFYDIPKETFSSLKIKLVILLISEPDQIQKNLLGRDGSSMPISEIEAFQCREIERSREVCKELGLNLIEASSKDFCKIKETIKNL